MEPIRSLADALLPRATWRRNQVAVTVAASLLFFGFTLVMPFLPLFIASLGVQGSAVEIWSGLALFTAPFLAALMGPVWGRMTDRYGMKIMVQRIVIAMTLHWTLMYFVASLAHLMVLRVMLGVFSGFGTISIALVTHGVPREKVGGVVGTLQSAQILSAAAGPAVGGVLFDLVGIRPTFLITAGICAIGFVLVTFAYREVEPGERTAPESPPRPLSLPAILRLPGVLPILGLLFLASLVDRSFGLIVPLFLRDLVPEGTPLGIWSGLTVSGGSFAGAASAYWMGRAAERGRPRTWILWGLVLGAVFLLAMAVSRGPREFALMRLLHGLAAGGLLTLGYTLASERVGERSRATSYGVLSGGAMLGGSVGPLAAGFLAPLIGMRGFLAGAAGILLSLALLARPGARRERQQAGREPRPPYIPLPR